MRQGAGNIICLLGVVLHGGKVEGGSRHENDRGVEDVRILLVGLDVACADGLEADALLERLLADAHLLPIALGGHAHHVALGVDVVLGELNVLEDTVDPVVIIVQHADAQQHDAGKITVALDLPEIRSVEQHLVAIYQLRAGGEEHIVCRALPCRAQLIGRVLLQHQLA